MIRYRRKAVEVLSRFYRRPLPDHRREGGEEMGLAYQPFWARGGGASSMEGG